MAGTVGLSRGAVLRYRPGLWLLVGSLLVVGSHPFEQGPLIYSQSGLLALRPGATAPRRWWAVS